MKIRASQQIKPGGRSSFKKKVKSSGRKCVYISKELFKELLNIGIHDVAPIPVIGALIGIVGVANSVFQVRHNISETKEMSGRAKWIPIGLVFVKMGDVLSASENMINVIRDAGKGFSDSLLTHLSTASTFLGVVTIGLQVLGIGYAIIGVRSLQQQKAQFDKEGWSALIPEKKGVSRVFNAFTEKQRNLIKSIFHPSPVNNEGLQKDVKKLIKERFTHLKQMKAIGIAISVLSVVGIALLCFAPTPAAPIAWAFIGTAAVIGIARLIRFCVLKHRFEKQLEFAAYQVENVEMQDMRHRNDENEDYLSEENNPLLDY